MIPIHKSNEPKSLLTYRSHPEALFDGPDCNELKFSSVKQDIRIRLVKDQGYLCAYCMCRIWPDEKSMRVEHWQCQDRFPEKQLDYANLLGCCCGNEGGDEKQIGCDAKKESLKKDNYGSKKGKITLEHCDKRKGDSELLFNPANPMDHARLRIRYTYQGTLKSDDSVFDDQLNTALNLNYSRLVENRKAVWSAVTRRLSEFQGSASRKQVEELIAGWEAKDQDGCLKEYCGVAIYYLNKKKGAAQKSL
jgi:uncharacterized protein (TIGR02646 family)